MIKELAIFDLFRPSHNKQRLTHMTLPQRAFDFFRSNFTYDEIKDEKEAFRRAMKTAQNKSSPYNFTPADLNTPDFRQAYQRAISEMYSELYFAGEELSAVFTSEKYTWFAWKGPKAMTITSKKNREITLLKGAEFGVREATSKKGMFRVITKELGPSHVFSMDKAAVDKLIKGAWMVNAAVEHAIPNEYAVPPGMRFADMPLKHRVFDYFRTNFGLDELRNHVKCRQMFLRTAMNTKNNYLFKPEDAQTEDFKKAHRDALMWLEYDAKAA